jgi:hypothetical protein
MTGKCLRESILISGKKCRNLSPTLRFPEPELKTRKTIPGIKPVFITSRFRLGGKQLPYIPIIKSSSTHSGLIADD